MEPKPYLTNRDPGDEHEDSPPLRAGDRVLHHPSGETWVVKRVLGDRLEWCGWPPGQADVADCTRVYACTDAEHQAWVEYLAKPPGERGAFPAIRRMDREDG